MTSKNNINEDLNRFKNLLGYNPEKGTINEAKVRRTYLTEEDPEEEVEPAEKESGEDINADFDFGDEGSPEEGGGDFESDFDFGDEGSPEEEVEDEFGTASEFSAVDDIETDEDIEEIDVTDIVTKSDEAKEIAQQAVTVGQENSSYLQALTDKLSNLETQLTKMDTIASKIGKLEQDIKTPEERLELRSLDSYPFNQKLSDYWEEKASQNDNYRVSTGESSNDEGTKEYVITKDDVDDYNEVDVRDSFNPESTGEVNIYKRQQY